MTRWEKTIVDAFIESYYVSAAESGRNFLRLRSASVFPGFDGAGPDEKESYLEAAEALERRGLLTLNWEKRGRGERLKTLSCPDMEALFEASGRKNRRAEAGEIRAMIRNRISGLEKKIDLSGKVPEAEFHKTPFPVSASLQLLKYLAENFSSADFGRGINRGAMEDLFNLLEFFFGAGGSAVTTRALSVMLYNDSKRLESLLELFGPLFSRLHKQGVIGPDFSVLERSFPEAAISGRLVFEYGHDRESRQPFLTNDAGRFLSLPLPTVRGIKSIRTIDPKDSPSVLTVENKETFFVLGEQAESGMGGAGLHFDCCLYSGGYPNQAAAALIRILAASGFSFYHAGDLDPDGILILQNIADIAGRPVLPLCMDAAVFDRYLPWARPLGKTILSRTEKIREDTRAVPGLAELIRRIEETRRGVEQEVIDYSVRKV